MKIRGEVPADIPAIYRIHAATFRGEQEARLVDALRDAGDLALSLVAQDDEQLVGHAAFSTMRVELGGIAIPALGLAPVATLPGRQRQGIGSMLIRAGLDLARETGTWIVFVLGDPTYYGRFGFRTDVAAPFACTYSGPYLMARIFNDRLDLSQAGKADYAQAFSTLGA